MSHSQNHVSDQLDGAWKCALDCMLEEFLLLCFPAIAAGLEFACPITSLDTELHQPANGSTTSGNACHADRVVHCQTFDGRQVCLHIEVQCQRDDHFTERMFVYNTLLFAKYRQPVISLAILGDQCLNWRPCEFGYDFAECSLHLRFGVVKLLDLEPALPGLLASWNPFAWFVAAHLKTMRTKGEPLARLHAKCKLTEILFGSSCEKERVAQLLELLDRLMHLPEKQDLQYRRELLRIEEVHMLTLSQRIKHDAIRRGLERGTTLGVRLGLRTGHAQGIEQGIELGIEKGREEGRRLALLELIEQRFGPIPEHLLAELRNGGVDDVVRWSKRFCDATTLEDLFA